MLFRHPSKLDIDPAANRKFESVHIILDSSLSNPPKRLPEQERNMTNILKFLSSFVNSEISRRIAENGMSEDMTLQNVFVKCFS